MKIQVTLTVEEGKRVIARGISSLPEVNRVMKQGILLLKGGTTVSAVSEDLVGVKLRISGRITERGAVSAEGNVEGPHSIVIRNGKPETADGHLEEIVSQMGPSDLAICGANIIDGDGNAAMMAGRFFGGEPGRILPLLHVEGVPIIVAAGLEKYCPLSLREAMSRCGRNVPDMSMGMSVGLVPIVGKVFSEIDGIYALGATHVTVIGRGGIYEGAGSTTFLIEGDKSWASDFMEYICSIKGTSPSGIEDSLKECLRCGPGAQDHLNCIYKGRMNNV
ncbi:MAG: hypothetical protein H5T90_06070 [Acetomicrobium sp.]|nr:hypothetical protein [Acetomicrobium sp.]